MKITSWLIEIRICHDVCAVMSVRGYENFLVFVGVYVYVCVCEKKYDGICPQGWSVSFNVPCLWMRTRVCSVGH